MMNFNEAYQFLVKKHMALHSDRKTQRVFKRWHRAGEKAAVVVEVMSSITASKTAKQRKKEENQKVFY